MTEANEPPEGVEADDSPESIVATINAALEALPNDGDARKDFLWRIKQAIEFCPHCGWKMEHSNCCCMRDE